MSHDALEALAACPWPGNVRQLHNVLWRAVVESTGEVRTRDLIDGIGAPGVEPICAPDPDPDLLALPWKIAKRRHELAFARTYVEHHLQRTGGEIKAAAQRAGIARSNFSRLVSRAED